MRWIFRSFQLLFSALVLSAQVNAPKVGFVRYADASVHAVFGLHNDYVVSRKALGSADAVSFSDSGGMIASKGRIQLFGSDSKVIAEYDSGEIAPLLNIDGDLATAIAWLPSQQALLHWNGAAFVLTTFRGVPLSNVSSVRLTTANTARLLLVESGGAVAAATVSLETGDLLSLNLLGGVAGPAVEQHSFLLFHDQYGLEIQAANGSMQTLPVKAADLRFERMSSDWLHVSSASAGRDWALHFNGTKVEFSELPGAPSVLEAGK